MVQDDRIGAAIGEAARSQLDRRLAAIHAAFAEEATMPVEELQRRLRAWTRSHQQTRDIEQVVRLAERVRNEFAVLVTIGIGGSDLSARVYHDVLNHPYHNLLPPKERGGAPEVYFTGDTFDPMRLNGLLDMLTSRGLLSQTLFNVISKSGRTGETIASLMIVRDALRALPGASTYGWRRQVVATTGLNDGSALFQLHGESPFYGDELLPVPDGVGGRFSAFSPVGTFFLAATAGKGETPRSRLEDALAGVEDAAGAFAAPPDADANVACRLARWLHVGETFGGKSTVVFYHYADCRSLGDWFTQLVEESIQERGEGVNVIPTCGPTGNHSILNGILAGPRDKSVLFTTWEDLGTDRAIPADLGIDGEMKSLEGLTMAQMQAASYSGTAEDLTANGIPTATLWSPRRDARSLCRLMRVFMDTVAMKGRLQRLHVTDESQVDPTHDLTYLQDGVEGYKKRTLRFAVELRKA